MSISTYGDIVLPTASLTHPEVPLAAAMQQIGSLVSGIFEKDVASTTSPYTLTQTNEMTVAEYHASYFRYHGTRSAVLTVIHDPTATPRLFIVFNDATTKTITVKVASGGTGVDVLSGESRVLRHDGTNVYGVSGITDWTGVTFQNSWVNYGSGVQNVEYRKRNDIVEVRGAAKDGVADTIFTLPAGFRPPAIMAFAAPSNALFGQVNVNTDGTVVKAVGSNVIFNLNFSFSVT